MHMRDWISKLDDFLRAGGQKILNHSGSVSAEDAKLKAEHEFDKFEVARRALEDANAEAGFAKEIDKLAGEAKELPKPKLKPKK